MSEPGQAKPHLQIIIGSTRPRRVGETVARWFYDRAARHGGFTVELVDLREVDLPMFDEPRHPRLGEYEHEHTRAWSATIARGDAYVFVHPEYNHGVNAATKNAIDFLNREWAYKAVGFVSYGGVAAGTRALAMLRPIVAALKMVAVTEAVNIPFVSRLLSDDGELEPNDIMDEAAEAMLDALAWMTKLLAAGRAPA